jgi:hypothetical protein
MEGQNKISTSRASIFFCVLLQNLLIFGSGMVFSQDQSQPSYLLKELEDLDRLHRATKYDSMKLLLDDLLPKLKRDSASLDAYNYGYGMGEYHLFLGNYFRQQALVDSATFHYQKAMDYHAKFTNYIGWYEAMTLSVEYLFTKGNTDKYLEEITKGYDFLKEQNPSIAENEYSLFLRKKFFPLKDQKEKLTTISKVDSLFSINPSLRTDRNNFIYFLDVLEWAYQTNNEAVIARYRPLYENTLTSNKVDQNYANYYEALFAHAAGRLNDAIGYYQRVASAGDAQINIKGSSINNLYRLAIMKGDSANALIQFQKLIQLRDSINALARYDEAEDLRRENEKQALEIKLNRAEVANLQQVQLLLIAGISFFLLISITLVLLKRNQAIRQKRKLSQAALEKVLEQARNKEVVWLSKLALLEQLKNREQIDKKVSPFNEDVFSEEHNHNHDQDDSDVPVFLRDQLIEINPRISNRELKLAAFIYAGYDNHDLERIFAISADAVRKAKYRLKKKLGLDKEEHMEEWIKNIEPFIEGKN